jgi:LmbE family N-acetylglucosaminyl deacetylase
MNRSLLAIAAHPDDIEFLMSGTMLHFREAGYELHYLNLSSGNLGSQDHDEDETARMRADEARAAALLLGATWHPPFLHDLEIFYDIHAIRHLSGLIREIQPSLILTHSLEDYMEDHTCTARLAVTAAFSRGMKNFRTHPERPIHEGEVAVYHAQPHMNRDAMGKIIRPALFVDIGAVMDTREKALAVHRTQQSWLDASQGMDSYLSTMRDNAREVGQLSGRFEYAEGWRPHSRVGFCSADFDPFRDLPAPILLRQAEALQGTDLTQTLD